MAVRLMSTYTQETTTVVECGIKLSWPDGHTEVEPRDGRASAEDSVALKNRQERRDTGRPSAVVVRREVTITAWEVAR